MTEEDAIDILIRYSKYAHGIYHNNEADVKAFIMAIEAIARGKDSIQVRTEQEEKLP